MKMILIRNLRLNLGAELDALKPRIARKLGVSVGEICELKLIRRSLDARRKDDLHYVVSVATELPQKAAKGRFSASKDPDLVPYEKNEVYIPRVNCKSRPVVVGFGPAGIFAALYLARAGARPIVLERGGPVEERHKKVEDFRARGVLDTECNVQFGEGGAGAFSDGKLNTGTHDKRLPFVLREFYRHGAPESILYDAKPHVGTDILTTVVKNIREEIISLGGEVRFYNRLEALEERDGELSAAKVLSPEGEYTLPCEALILALGHSARDTFEMLEKSGLELAPKPFAMGVRIEHKQSDVDAAQYGRERGELPAADYALNVRLPDGNSAFTFCMCPGGEVIAAASEAGGVVTNGMSYNARAGENANAALLVTLRPEDFPDGGPLGGMYWQREIERRAFTCGGGDYKAPAQLLGDFLDGRESTAAGRITPSYRPGVRFGSLDEALPEKICSVLRAAIPELNRKMRGFSDPDAVLTAPETRSSSPVRIVRGEDFAATRLRGLFPCGEGAGYAGGISSAAADGVKCAEAALEALK